MEFIEKTKIELFPQIEIGRRVACIGAGNTAIDVVTAARRLGAEIVYLIYRRGPRDASAFEYALELAKKDSVVFLWRAQPARTPGHKGVVNGPACGRPTIGPREWTTRRTELR